MSALNKKSFLTYLKEAVFTSFFSFAGNYYFPGPNIFKSVELK